MSSYYEHLLVGCGSRGLAILNDLLNTLPEEAKSKILALEASSRIGGTQFLISRLTEGGTENASLYEVQRQLPELRIWWERAWINAHEVDWKNSDWAYVLPQWQSFFKPQVELKVKSDIIETVKPFVELEKPVSEISYTDGTWTVQSGDKTYATQKLHWTLGLKALQACVGKKQAEAYMEKNPQFIEAARDAEGVFVADYQGAQGESQFVGIPVRYGHKLYLCFVSLHEGRVETFTFLHSDILKQPKELSSFEKAIKRTLKHTLSNSITELTSPTLGVFTEAKGYTLASPWRFKTIQEIGIYFVNEELNL